MLNPVFARVVTEKIELKGAASVERQKKLHRKMQFTL